MSLEETIAAAIEAKLAQPSADHEALLALAEDLGAYCADLLLSGEIPSQGSATPTTGETVGLLADKTA